MHIGTVILKTFYIYRMGNWISHYGNVIRSLDHQHEEAKTRKAKESRPSAVVQETEAQGMALNFKAIQG